MSIWQLFPFPTWSAAAGFQDGTLVPVPSDCRTCISMPCRASLGTALDVSECRYGLTHMPIDRQRLVLGVATNDRDSTTRKARKAHARLPANRARSRDIQRAVFAARELGPGVVYDFEKSKQAALEGLSEDQEIFRALQRELMETFNARLNKSHDFLQLVKLVKGYAEVLLDERAPTLDPVAAAEQFPAEGSIYFLTRLMLAKMDTMRFVLEPNLAAGGQTRFQLHPFVLMWIRVYSWQAREKGVDLRLSGECYERVWYNADAVGAVIQSLLDNMIKYAPSESRADVHFGIAGPLIELTFTSLGPEIAPDELDPIFLPGVRARAADAVDDTGLGLGLAAAKQLSDAMQLGLAVTQRDTEDVRFPGRFETTFRVRFTAG